MDADEFFQAGPSLGHPFSHDPLLRSYLKRILPGEMHDNVVEPDLLRFGSRITDELEALAIQAESEPPRHIPYDPWGRRVDHIETSAAWQSLHRVAAEEGLVALGYERDWGQYSRLYQFAKLYLYGPSSAIYSCPLAMTDGAARLLEVHGGLALRERALSHLTSRDPERFWTSGQWMTERRGGSDVSGTGTVAYPAAEGYELHGTKWFTSATTSAMTMTLARIADADGSAPEGSRGLSLFYLETRDDAGDLNRIRIHRLKEKLGTRALPTAELSLEGTPARLIGKPQTGVRTIATLFNMTRIYNAVMSAGMIRRTLHLAQDYARKRHAFGKVLAEHPLHQTTLARLAMEFRVAFLLSFSTVELQGRIETGDASEDDVQLLRVLTPVAKLYTAKQAVACTSEVVESFGGAGYCEDTGIPKWLRDAQVLSIWEGTTNVLSLDMLRAFAKENGAEAMLKAIHAKLHGLKGQWKDERQAVETACGKLSDYLQKHGPVELEEAGRDLAYGFARTFAAALLMEHADDATASGIDLAAGEAARRWCRGDLVRLPDGEDSRQTAQLAFES